jgi:dihydropteroate synthase
MAKRQPQHSPLWMGIINATPDSFSDGGANSNPEALVQKLDDWDAHFVAVIDIGAESTRPGAQLIDTDEEWKRLEPVLKMLIDRYEGRLIRPRLSVDTRYAKTAARALACGIDIINDVSGLQDPGMTDVLRDSSAPYVLMHNLGIPADKKTHLPQQCDPIEELIRWFEEKTALLEKSGIARDRIILDPGIGFGKTGLQSIDILRNLSQLKALPYRLLIGHSRKSFLDPFSSNKAAQRDLESAGVSIHLAADGADILRVHDPVTHIRTFRAWNHLNRSRA